MIFFSSGSFARQKLPSSIVRSLAARPFFKSIYFYVTLPYARVASGPTPLGLERLGWSESI